MVMDGGNLRRLNDWLGRYTEFIINNRWVVLSMELALILGLAVLFLPKIKQDVSFVSVFGKDSAVKKNSDLFKQKYGRDEVTVVGVGSKQIFTLPFLKKLKSLHEDLENCSVKITEVTSLINARLTEGKDDEILVRDLLEDFPKNETDLANLRRLVMTNTAYRNTLISPKGDFTTLVIETGLITDLENIDVVAAIEKAAQKYNSPDFSVLVAGSPAIMKVLDAALAKDFGKFIGLTLLTIGVILFLLFKRASVVAAPFATIILTLLGTLTLQAIFRAPISTVTNALIPYLIAVGIGDSLHIIAVFLSRWQFEETRPALIATVKNCAVPCFFTSITTMAGLFAFINRDIVTIRDLGIYGGVGTLIAYLLTMTIVVIGLSFLKRRPNGHVPKAARAYDSFIVEKATSLALFGYKHYLGVLAFVACGALVIGYYITQVKVVHDPLSWLAKTEPVVAATRKLDRYLRGSVGLELMINTGREGKFKEPATLKKIEVLENKAKNFRKDGKPFISSATSLPTMLKEVHKAINEGKQEYYVIPDDQNLIAQELLLFETGGGGKMLFDYVAADYSDVRMTFRAPWIDTAGYQGFLKFIRDEAQKLFADDRDIKKENIILCGNMAVFSEAIHAMLPLSINGFGIAFIIIAIFMILLLRDLKLGLLSMIPNLYPIGLALAVMGAFKINLDMFNLFVGSLALGIVVDDTIHVIHHVRSNMADGNASLEKSLQKTMKLSGEALVMTTLILCLGFASYLFSSMGNIYSFGILLIITLFSALLADLLITPAVLALYYQKPKFIEGVMANNKKA
jgi:predicted RND superfamily exporter protein